MTKHAKTIAELVVETLYLKNAKKPTYKQYLEELNARIEEKRATVSSLSRPLHPWRSRGYFSNTRHNYNKRSKAG